MVSNHDGEIGELKSTVETMKAEIAELRADVRALRTFRDVILGGTGLVTFVAGILAAEWGKLMQFLKGSWMWSKGGTETATRSR